MKNVTRIIGILMLFALSFGASAQNYCMTAPEGWGAGTTGAGTGKTPAVVTSESALKSALKSNAFVIIDGAITINKTISLDGLSNITILGRNNATLNIKSGKDVGGFYIKGGSKNIIIRNIKFAGPGAVDINGDDPLCIDKSTQIWVDHCEFVDGCDGNFDIKNAADKITVTWCKFTYTNKSKDHEFSNLIGSSDGATDDAGKLNITFQYCWWENVVERMPRVRFGKVHVANCYYNSRIVNMGCITAGKDGNVRVERNYFDGVKNPLDGDKFSGSSVINALDNYYTGCSAKGKGYAKDGKYGSGTPFTPPYTLTMLPEQEAKTAVTGSCGAGATLQVTEAGVVSSSCGGVTPPPVPSLTVPSGIVANSSANSISLSWNAVTGAEKYVVQLCHEQATGSTGSPQTLTYNNWTANAGSIVSDTANGVSIDSTDGNGNAGSGNSDYLELNGNADILTVASSKADITKIEFTYSKNNAENTSQPVAEYQSASGAALGTSNFPSAGAAFITNSENCPAGTRKIVVKRPASMTVRISAIKVSIGGATSTTVCDEPYQTNVARIVIQDLAPNTEYTYQVKAVKGTDASDYSPAAKITTSGASAIGDVEASKFVVYQSNDNLVVKGDDVQSLAVYSLVGTTIAKNEHQNEINLSGVPSGVYIVNINNGAVKKFIWK